MSKITKTIKVTFIDGQVQSLDADKAIQALGPQVIGMPANHEYWLRTLQQIAVNGVIADGATDKHVTYQAPSQIKTVELIFEGGDSMTIEK